MSGAEYQVILCDPFGVRLADASNFVRLSYTRVVNDVSTLTLALPASFDTNRIRIPDGRIEVWRRLPGGREYLDTEMTWLIKKLRQKRDASGLVTIEIEADHPLCILSEPGRFVDAFAGSADAAKTDEADDMMKDIVLEQAGIEAAASSRSFAAYLSVEPVRAKGPSLTKAFAWQSVLRTLQDIANDAAQAGTYVAFDIVAPTPDTLEFRTYTQQRGVDHRFPGGQNPVILSPEFGNLGEVELIEDYRDEVTYAKAGGQGEGTARTLAAAADNTRIGMSPFGWREVFVDATQTASTTVLTGVARAAVRAGRPRLLFRGKILDTPDTRYGVHWGWGDYVTAQAFGKQFDCRIDAVTVTVEDGEETIDAWLKAEVAA